MTSSVERGPVRGVSTRVAAVHGGSFLCRDADGHVRDEPSLTVRQAQ